MLYTSLLSAQQRVYRHFTIDDGLAGNKAYAIMQDRQGFIWVATDQGLCRFNGREFKIFTAREGLSGNEVTDLYTDRLGRLWYVCFRSPPSFLENGKMHNEHNTPWLQPEPGEIYRNFYFDELTREFWIIYISSGKTILFNTFSGERLSVDSFKAHESGEYYRYTHNGRVYFILHGHHFLQEGNRLILQGQLNFYERMVPQNKKAGNILLSFNGNMLYLRKIEKNTERILGSFTLPGRIVNLQYISDSLVYVFVKNKGLFKFLPDRSVQPSGIDLPGDNTDKLIYDNQGNIWMNSLTNGIYMYPQKEVYVFNRQHGLFGDNVSSVHVDKHKNIYCGFDNAAISMYSSGRFKTILLPGRKTIRAIVLNRVLSMASIKGSLYAATDEGLALVNIAHQAFERWTPDPGPQHHFGAIKDLDTCNNGKLLFAKSNAAGYLKVDSGGAYVVLFKQRTHAVHKDGLGNYWFGTLQGLYHTPTGTQAMLYTADSILAKSRITDISSSRNGLVFVTTYQDGFFILKGNTVLHFHNQGPGYENDPLNIAGNVCKSVHTDSQGTAWVSTNKGLYRVEVKDLERGVFYSSVFNKLSGLPTDDINAVTSSDSLLFIASAKGLVTMQKENGARLNEQVMLPVLLEGFYVNSQERNTQEPLALKAGENMITIRFTALSLRSNTFISYKYRLLGLGTKWMYTAETKVDFISLAPGNYTFQVMPANVPGLSAAGTAAIAFSIARPFYRTWWFLVLVILCTGSLMLLYLRFRIKQLQKAQEQKMALSKTLATYEMQALRAQMNPHFIFNALNSIQNFFMQGKEEEANSYMSKFSTLIRQMLNASGKNFIALNEELSLLSNYLDIEQLRLRDKLSYSVEMDPAIQPEQVELPQMLLQPFVENAIKHGIRNLPGNARGHIRIAIGTENGNRISVTIEDNGIGINQAKAMSHSPGHRSQGLSLTLSRIDNMNKIYNLGMKLSIEDLSETDRTKHGTKVYLSFLADNG